MNRLAYRLSLNNINVTDNTSSLKSMEIIKIYINEFPIHNFQTLKLIT